MFHVVVLHGVRCPVDSTSDSVSSFPLGRQMRIQDFVSDFLFLPLLLGVNK